MRGLCRASLADYELYVADFYLNGNKPWSARKRLENVVETFPDTARQWRLAALKLVRTYQVLAGVTQMDIEPVKNGHELAKALAKKLHQRFPDSKEAQTPLIKGLQ